VPESQKPQGVWSLLRTRLLSFGVILGLVFLLMVSLVVSAALSAVGGWAGDAIPGGAVVLQAVNLVVSLAVATVLFAFIFKVLPSTRIAWRDVWVGAFTTAVLFEIGKSLIGLYLGKSSTTQAFAAAGSLVVLIAWVYYAAQIFLLGAEFTKVYAHEHGSRKAMQMPTANAEAAAPVAQPSPQPAAALPAVSAARPAVAATPAPGKAPVNPSMPATARLQETRHRLEVEVPPSAVHLKKVAKGASAAAAGVVALAVVARQLLRSKRGTRATAGLREALGKRAHALAKRAPVLRKRGILRFGA
jgi:hypothetical protein